MIKPETTSKTHAPEAEITIIVGKDSEFGFVVDSFLLPDCEGEAAGGGFWSGDWEGTGDSEGVKVESDFDDEDAPANGEVWAGNVELNSELDVSEIEAGFTSG